MSRGLSQGHQRENIHVQITDDAMVVETMLCTPVKLYEGSYDNIKITTPEDMVVAEAFLNAEYPLL